jgi:ribosomal protein S18 acetylase RimI-like enzyme
MEFLFRRAQPQDAEEASRLVYSVGPEGFDYTFSQGNTTAPEFLRYAFLEGGGFFGYRNHIVVEAAGRLVGTGAFYSGHEYNALSIGISKQIFRFYGFPGFLSVMRRSFQALSLTPPPRKDMEYIADLAVTEDMRSRGIATALLERQKEVARRKGRRVYALDVSVNNPRARKLYERLGFKVTGYNRFRGRGETSSVPDSQRMELYL